MKTDNHSLNELGNLWQNQPVSSPSSSQLKKQWQMHRQLQQLSIVGDLLTLLVIVSMTLYFVPRLGVFGKSWMLVILLTTTSITSYFIYLRRKSINPAESATSSYHEKLIQHAQAVIRIRRASQYITLPIGVLVAILHIGITLLGELPGAQLNMSFMFTLLGIVGLCLLIYGWNAWQIKRKQTELETLRRLLEEE